LDLRQFIAWCEEHRLRLFAARRADIECFARDLEARGRARATVARRLCTVAGFYRYAAIRLATWDFIGVEADVALAGARAISALVRALPV
jgi:site-specific recombinase XerD